MRPSLLPGLVTAVQANINRGVLDVALFEVGQVFLSDGPEGEYLTDRQGNGVDLMLGVRVGAPGKRGIVLGANASLYDGGPHTLVCHQATRRDGCIQPFPFFELAGALVGWENASTTFRVMGGPAWAHAESDALAWQARLDGALPVVWRLALVGSVRGTIVPKYRGDAVKLLALGLGLRVR